LALSQELR